MSDELSREILIELKKINEKLDTLKNEPKGLSIPMKLFAFFVMGPLVVFLFLGVSQYIISYF